MKKIILIVCVALLAAASVFAGPKVKPKIKVTHFPGKPQRVNVGGTIFVDCIGLDGKCITIKTNTVAGVDAVIDPDRAAVEIHASAYVVIPNGEGQTITFIK